MPAHTFHFIINEHSGLVRRRWHELRSYLEKNDIPFTAHRTKERGHAEYLTEKICDLQEKELRIVVVGGDGTINEILNGITDFDRVRLGVIPLGSANDFAKGLGLKREPMEALQDILNADGEERMDIGRVVYEDGRKRCFGISAGIGMDAVVCKKALTSRLKKILNVFQMGQAIYILLTISTLVSMEYVPVRIAFDGGERETFPNLIFAAGMNMPIEGGGVRMAPNASFADGRLSLCAAYGISRAAAPFYLIRLVAAKHEDAKGFLVRDFETIDIETEQPMVLHLDGEYGGEVSRLRMECLKNRLRLMR